MAMEVKEAKIEGERGIVILEGDDAEELLGSRARKLAYTQRTKLGLSTAGLEDREFGPIIEEGATPGEKPTKFQKIFYLNPMPV